MPLDPGTVDGEAAVAGGPEEAAIAGVADERHVGLLELALEAFDDQGAVGGILSGLLVVEADDVAGPGDLDGLGAVVGVLVAPGDRRRHEGGGIGEHQVEAAEQIAAPGQQPLFDHILHAARRKRGGIVLVRFGHGLAEPGPGAVEMVQLDPVHAGNRIVLAPALGGKIRSAAHQPVQYGQEHGALEGELVASPGGQFFQHGATAGLFPQPLEDQRRPDPLDRHAGGLVVAHRLQDDGLGGEPGARAQPPLQLAPRLQLVEPAEGGDDLLANGLALAPALDDLQVAASGGGLVAEIHGCARLKDGTHMILREDPKQERNQQNRGTTLF